MKFLYYLLILVPVAIILQVIGAGHTWIFITSALALVPLAGLLGDATEQVAEHTGARVGGLLNATFGNAAELIITIVAIQRGLIELAKASISGSIIGNILLVLGASLLVGGLKNGRKAGLPNRRYAPAPPPLRHKRDLPDSRHLPDQPGGEDRGGRGDGHHRSGRPARPG